MPSVSRRRVIGGGLVASGSLLVAGAARFSQTRADEATLAPGHMAHGSGDLQGLIPGPSPWESADLVEPEESRSVDGVLETELHAQYTWKDGGGYQLFMRSYEGTIPGPTLRLQPGDALKIRLRNQLPPSRDEDPRDEDLPHHLNSTNFHFHGAHVSPGGFPTTSSVSSSRGRATTSRSICPAITPAAPTGITRTITAARISRSFTVNGQREPIIRLRPGEVQRRRILHAGYQDDILMSLDGHRLLPTARDGIRLTELGGSVGVTQPASVGEAPPEAVLFAPGQRVDVLVQAGEPGEYLLQALPYFQGYDAPTDPISRIIVGASRWRWCSPPRCRQRSLRTSRTMNLRASVRSSFHATPLRWTLPGTARVRLHGR